MIVLSPSVLEFRLITNSLGKIPPRLLLLSFSRYLSSTNRRLTAGPTRTRSVLVGASKMRWQAKCGDISKNSIFTTVATKGTKALAAWLVQADWVLAATSPNKCGDEVTDAVRLSEGSQTIDSSQL